MLKFIHRQGRQGEREGKRERERWKGGLIKYLQRIQIQFMNKF